MSNFAFQANQIVCFRTNYFRKNCDLTGYRYYLLKEIDQENKMLVFFPIISSRSKESVLYNQCKIKNRPICLDSKIYSEIFVDINYLIKVPINLAKFLERNCKNIHQTCFEKGEFRKILELYNYIVEFQEILKTDIEIIKLVEKNFVFQN